MLKYFAVSWLQHGQWVNLEYLVLGQPLLAKELAEIALLPGVSTIRVDEVNEENCVDYGAESLFPDYEDYL